MATFRQKLTASKLVDNGGKVSMGKAMRESGYKKSYAKNPQKLKKTLSWLELMDKYLPDKLLSKKHGELLNKKEYVVIGRVGERKIVPTGEIDPNAVARGLDLAYKLKSRYPKETLPVNSNNFQISDETLNRILKG